MDETGHSSPQRADGITDDGNEVAEVDIEVSISDDEDDPESHTVHFRPLTYFIKYHVGYITPRSSSSQFDCPICRENCSDLHERLVQINLPACHHVFCADCFDKHIQHSNICPMCRSQWFKKHKGSSETIFHVTISVRDEGLGDMLEEQLARGNGGQLLREILNEQITLLGDSTADNDTQSANSLEVAELSEAGTSNASPARDPRLEAAGEDPSSEASAEGGSNTSGVVRREITQSIEISDEEVAAGTIDWTGEHGRSTSDEEANALPRQRRRYE